MGIELDDSLSRPAALVMGPTAMFSILHITDLHRAKTDPLTNAELLSALISDRESYEQEDPPIRSPDAIIVSGDVIQGVPLGEPDYSRKLTEQYAVAHDFLAVLADHFLNGDRTKVIIVPGNHDIDWNVAFASMRLVDDAEAPSNLPGALYEPDSLYRWDWRSRRLYVIADPQKYRQRLEAFWTFFERFYGDFTWMLRVAPWSDANLFSLDNGRIGVAAFNSCVGNDCFAFRGEIAREDIAQAHLDLKDLGPWRLRLAVWHHDVEGPPHRGDYMDVEIVRGMIGRGFRLGLYGHQHRLQITPQHAHLLNQETMAIVSAGSLCAGARELPTGALRGYSIVEVQEDYCSARVHVREMRFANLFSRAVLREFQGRSYVDIEWTRPVDAAGRPEDSVEQVRVDALRAAEDALHGRQDAAEALKLLDAGDLMGDPFGRRMALDAAVLLGDPLKMIEVITKPQTIEEMVLLVDAHIAAGNGAVAASAIAEHALELSVPEPILKELRARADLMKWSKS